MSHQLCATASPPVGHAPKRAASPEAFFGMQAPQEQQYARYMNRRRNQALLGLC